MNALSIIKSVANLVYPLHCAGCSKILESSNELGVCDFCMASVKPNPRPHCRSCGRSIETAHQLCQECLKKRPYFHRAYSAYLYEDPLKRLICSLKYRSKLSLSKVLSKLLVLFVKDNPELLDGTDIITYVPLHTRSLRLRGFNQSKILAEALSSQFQILCRDTLEKPIPTKHQNNLKREARLLNLKGAFKVRRDSDIKGKTVLLVDDVMTTGATLSECSKVLSDAGAIRINCLTLARGI